MEGKKINYAKLNDFDEIKDIESIKEFEKLIKIRLTKYWKFENKNEMDINDDEVTKNFPVLTKLILENSESKNWPSFIREAYHKGDKVKLKEHLNKLSKLIFLEKTWFR